MSVNFSESHSKPIASAPSTNTNPAATTAGLTTTNANDVAVNILATTPAGRQLGQIYNFTSHKSSDTLDGWNFQIRTIGKTVVAPFVISSTQIDSRKSVFPAKAFPQLVKMSEALNLVVIYQSFLNNPCSKIKHPAIRTIITNAIEDVTKEYTLAGRMLKVLETWGDSELPPELIQEIKNNLRKQGLDEEGHTNAVPGEFNEHIPKYKKVCKEFKAVIDGLIKYAKSDGQNIPEEIQLAIKNGTKKICDQFGFSLNSDLQAAANELNQFLKTRTIADLLKMRHFLSADLPALDKITAVAATAVVPQQKKGDTTSPQPCFVRHSGDDMMLYFAFDDSGDVSAMNVIADSGSPLVKKIDSQLKPISASKFKDLNKKKADKAEGKLDLPALNLFLLCMKKNPAQTGSMYTYVDNSACLMRITAISIDSDTNKLSKNILKFVDRIALATETHLTQ